MQSQPSLGDNTSDSPLARPQDTIRTERAPRTSAFAVTLSQGVSTIVVLSAGFAGLETVASLSERMRPQQARVLVIDRSLSHVSVPE